MTDRDLQTTESVSRTDAWIDQRAIEAIRTFPLPAQSATSLENYQRILDWLYRGGQRSVAALVIDLEFGEEPSDE